MLMKKILLVIFALISLNTFAQLQVKEGSFKHVPNAVMNDKYDHLDGNDLPMALIKISTENISEQERLRLKFQGNLATQITKTPKTGQMWIYISAENATFINFMHPDYGTCKYYLPEKLCDFCTYEMVLQYVNAVPEMKTGFLVVVSDPLDADVYIDGKYSGKTVKVITDISVGTHELEISKQGYYSVKNTVTISAGETVNINETLQIKKEISISTDLSGDKIYVDGNYVGISPINSNISYGSHEIKAERNGKTVSKTINVAQSGGDNSVKLTFKQEYNGHEYVDLGLSVKWATCNVGANKPEDYGNYYAWGETKTKKIYSIFNSKKDGKYMRDISGYTKYDAARANWGGNWRMPTYDELNELITQCTWTWTVQNGVKGYMVTSKTNDNKIFLPAAGGRYGLSLSDAGERGHYWSSVPYRQDSDYYYLYFDSRHWGMSRFYCSYGYSVRPVID